MKSVMTKVILMMMIGMSAATMSASGVEQPRAVLVIHGGAGTILRTQMTAELEKQYREALSRALQTGYSILKKNGTSLDAVEAVVRFMEDAPLFNAGKGSVFTHDGRNEMDASIMDGKTGKAGAVAAVTILKNPISAARAVMEKSKHVMLAGRGAELFATEQGLEIVDPSYFWTERRWKQLHDELRKEREGKQHSEIFNPEGLTIGTVGAVAVDSQGNLAAATSTGGTTNKRFGRVGDSPVIGAGTFADNETCAVSGTGHGEYFLRYVVAYDVAALIKYKGLTPADASEQVIRKLKHVGGEGGVIVLDRKGNFAMPFNTAGMYRGYVGADGVPHVEIYGD